MTTLNKVNAPQEGKLIFEKTLRHSGVGREIDIRIYEVLPDKNIYSHYDLFVRKRYPCIPSYYAKDNENIWIKLTTNDLREPNRSPVPLGFWDDLWRVLLMELSKTQETHQRKE